MQITQTDTVGERVRREMALARVTQQVVARHLNLSQSAVSARLTGVTEFNVSELQAVAALLGVPAASLLPAEVAA